MKKILKVLLLVMVVTVGTVTVNEVKSQSASVSFSVFQNSLKPYGRWVNHGRYGQVWISNTRGFKPYQTGGHWAYTDYGWTWVSDYDWGWAPFHYGRWSYENSLGWYWVPGYEWSPAWVAWRGSGDVYGWAPLSPGLTVGVDLSFGNQIPYDRWVFAPHRYITSPYISRYYVDRGRNLTYFRNTKIVNNVTVRNNVRYVAGPRKADVERLNHITIKTYAIGNSSKPGKTVVNKNTINVYRPEINKTTVNNKTVVNNTNNNTTFKNNTTINKNTNNKTVTQNNTKKNTTVNTTVNNNKQTVNKPVENNKAVAKKEAQKPAVKKPLVNNTDISNKKVNEASTHPVAAKNTAEKKIVNNKPAVANKTQQTKQPAPANDKKKKPNDPPKK